MNTNKKYMGDEDYYIELCKKQQDEIHMLKNLLLDNQILLDKTLNAWAKEMERKK
jgi:hypothetical protein